MIFQMAFSVKAVGGGLCGTIVASMMNAMRYGVARGVFSNEAGMGSAAITAAAATTDNPIHNKGKNKAVYHIKPVRSQQIFKCFFPVILPTEYCRKRKQCNPDCHKPAPG